MLIQTNSDLFRLAQEDHFLDLDILGTAIDASKYGLHLVWNKKDLDCPSDAFKQVSEQITSLDLNIRVKTRDGYGIFILPCVFDETSPEIILQTIETDWWVGSIPLYFKNKKCLFKKDFPFAQVLVVPKQPYSIKQMSPDVVAQLTEAEKQIRESKLYTRVENMVDNTYQVLKYKNERNDLPAVLKQTRKPKLRLGIN